MNSITGVSAACSSSESASFSASVMAVSSLTSAGQSQPLSYASPVAVVARRLPRKDAASALSSSSWAARV